MLAPEFVAVPSHRVPPQLTLMPVPPSAHPSAHPRGKISRGGRLFLSSPARLAAAGGFARETRWEGAGYEAVPKQRQQMESSRVGKRREAPRIRREQQPPRIVGALPRRPGAE